MPPTAAGIGPVPADLDDGLDDGLDAAVRTFRTAAWVWLLAVTALSFASMDQPGAAAAGVGATALVTAAWWTPRSASARRRLLAAELVVGGLLVASDPWVFDDGRPQSFGGIWPLAGVLAVAVRAGARPAVAAGLALGVARGVGEVLDGGDWSASRVLAIASTGVLFALAGWAAAWAAQRLRRAERLVARSEARAEVAAELHDGVLQTLAVIQRRSGDADLVGMARSQEAALRRYLADTGGGDVGPTHVDVLLRSVVADATSRFGLRVEVATVPPLPVLGPDGAAALRGSIGEALANVAKHAGTDRAVVFAEAEDERLVVSVQDDGAGYDPAVATERGLAGSVRRRIDAIGGTVEVRSRPGAGTTVTVEVPLEGR
ncbi:MAG TPA: ATP-binding protein [Acidimicrobiales bacterium]|nr:ATP-binding protein [Acidimicrobiales bacterium]